MFSVGIWESSDVKAGIKDIEETFTAEEFSNPLEFSKKNKSVIEATA